MLQIIKNRRAAARDNDSGFTLIELMVVVLIIAILLAIAIPTFLGAQNKSKERAVQSSLRNTLTAAKTIYADDSNYTGVTNVTLLAVEPSLTYGLTATTVSSGPKNMSVSGSGQTFAAAGLSDTGACFGVKDVGGIVTFGKWAVVVGTTDCTGAQALTSSTLTKW